MGKKKVKRTKSKRVIPEFSNYAITKDGRIWSKPRSGSGCSKEGKWLKPGKTKNGYSIVCLRKNKLTYDRYVHRLVLEAYIGSCPNNMEACHNDGNRQNNNLSNLRWDTHSKNSLDAVKHGTSSGLKAKGSKHGKAKLFDTYKQSFLRLSLSGLFLQREIAKIYNISKQSISAIMTKTTWRHLWQ